MTQRTVVVLVTAAVILAAAVAGQADDALRWRIKQLQAELNRLQAQAATHAQLEADLENERRQKDAARQTLASVQQQLRDAQTSLVQGQERETALQQDLSQTQQRLAQAEAESAQLPGAQQALSSAQDELAGTQSALAEEQAQHRATRGMLSGVRQALEQASAAVVKLRFAQSRKDRENAAAQAELQAELLEAQQRQWQAEQDTVSLRQELSQANAAAAGLQAQVASAQGETSDAQASLAAVRQELADTRSALAQAQGRHGVVAQVLSSTQQRLAEARARSAQLQSELDGASRAAAVRPGACWPLCSSSCGMPRRRWCEVRTEQEAALQANTAAGLSQTQQRGIVGGRRRGEFGWMRKLPSKPCRAREDELAGTQSALAEEQAQHRATRGMLSGVRQALEQASAAVVKLRFAQSRKDRENAAAQAELQAELLEAQQRQWQAEQDTVSLRQELSQANAAAAGLQAQVASVQGEARDAQASLAVTRQKLADVRTALAEERRRYGATAQVLSSTQQALAEKQSELGHVSRVAAVRQGMLASVQQQLRDAQTTMVQSQEHQADLEQTLAQTRQDLAQASSAAEQAQGEIVRQAQVHEDRQSQMSRDLMEARSQGEATQLILASVREELARTRHTLEREQGRNAVQGEVLANTQAALSDASGSLAEVRAALADQAEAHADAQTAMQSDKQQWVERYWDMEQKRNETRVALRREEQAHQGTQQTLDQTTRQARIDEIQQSQLRRDVEEARQALERMRGPSAAATALADVVRQRFAEEIEQNQLSVRTGRRGVKLVSADLFDFARAVELGSRSVQTLDRLVEMLQEAPSHHVRFQVHTDNIPLRRGARWPTNWELSTARAAKLARYLIDQGVAPERLSIGGYGDSRPVADNSTPEGRQQNRRVEVIIKPPRQR